MSAFDRSLARLPLRIFDFERYEPKKLRESICNKLSFFWKGRKGVSRTQASVKTVGPLLELPIENIVQVLDPLLTFAECEELYRRICSECSPKSTTILDLLKDTGKDEHVPTGMTSLDHILRGGLRKGTVTEIVGAAGLGKTQFALQVCCEAAKYCEGSAYIDTEQKLDLGRLEEISQRKFVSSGGISMDQDGFYHDDADSNEKTKADTENMNQSSEQSYKAPHLVLSNMTVHKPETSTQLFETLRQIETEGFARSHKAEGHPDLFPMRLLVLDSIASHSLKEFESPALLASTLIQVAQVLKRLADQQNLAVLVVNQVSGGQQRAALGTSWHHCVTTRIQLSEQGDKRFFCVVKSNVTCQDKALPYHIDTGGLVDE